MSFPRYPEYKDSGVEWLGDVPAHWSVKRLRHVATLNPSKSEVAHLPRDTEVSFLPMEAVGDDGTLNLDRTRPIGEVESGYTYFREGDVTIAKITPCYENGKGALMRGLHNGHGFGTTELIVVRPSAGKTSSDYLHLLFTSHPFRRFGEASMYGAGGQKRVPDDFVRNFAVAFPPPQEQTAIATFLDRETAKIDALVAVQEKLIALLQEKRQAVISHAVTKGLDPSVPMKDSGVEWLGEVPGHWEVLPLKRCCSLLKDGTHLPPPRVADGVPLLSVRNVQNGQFGLLDDDSFISEKDYNELCRSFVPRPGDVLLAIVGATLGKTAVIPHGLGQFHIQRSLAIFRTAERLNSDWLHLIFQSDRFQTLLWEYVGYSAQPGIYLGTLCDFRVPVPPIDEQERITAMVKDRLDEFNELICEAKSAVTLLQERRTALISAAVTGQIDVRGLAGGANTPVSLASSAYAESA